MATAEQRKHIKNSRIRPAGAARPNRMGQLIQDRQRLLKAMPSIQKDVDNVLELIATATKGCNRQDMYRASVAYGEVKNKIITFLGTIDPESAQAAHINRFLQEMKFQFDDAASNNFYCQELCYND